MKALPSIAFNDFSGTAGDVTARHAKGRTVLTVRPFPSKVVSPSQKTKRNALAQISRAYKQLTDEQMKAWEQIAQKTKSHSVLGSSTVLTAHNLFVRLNSNRAYIGEGILTDAPSLDVEIPMVRYEDFCISEDYICFTGVEDQDDRFLLVAKMSDAQSAGVSSGWDKAVIIAPGNVPDWGDIDLTDAFVQIIGSRPINGRKYFIQLYWIDSETGLTGIPVQVSGICKEGSQITGETFGLRIAVRDADLIRDEYDHLHNFSLEFAPGSTIFTIEAEYDTGNYNVASAKGILPQAVADRFPNFRAYVCGRRGVEGKYWPSWYECNKWRWANNYEFNCSNRGGYWNRKGLIFGTSPTFKF